MGDDLISAGLIAGTAAGTLLLIRSLVDRNGAAAAMAALLLVGAAAGVLIMRSWSADQSAVPWLQLAEFALMMTVGPLSVAIVAALLRIDAPVAMLAGVAVTAFGVVAVLTAIYGGDPILYGIPIQCLYALYAWSLVARGRRVVDRRQRAYRQRLVAIALMAALSAATVASVVRALFTESRLLEPIVPLTISLLFLVLAGAALLILMWRGAGLFAAPADRRSDDRQLTDAAAETLRRRELYRRPDLCLEDLAAAVDVRAAELGSALSRSEWGSFAAMLQAMRVESVARMLREPRERDTSVEAIGMLCGFRSRSALYEAFRRNLGVTPAKYREKSCP